jgi:TolB-like protein
VPLRRHLAVFVLFASALLLAATPKPPATPTPRPAPTAAPTLPGTAQPVLLIYPFDAPTDIDPRYGNAVANIFAQVITETGGVKVLAIPSGIKREDYQKYAAVQHADYYISGYIQPIGSAAAIVTTLVDVNSDISVWETTTNISDVQDVGSQALAFRTILLQSAGVDRPEINAGPANTPTPSSTSGASTNLSNVLGDLFHGKSKPKETPNPNATPTPSKPARGMFIVPVTGNAQSSSLSSATADLYRAMNVYYTARMSAVAGDAAKNANAICGQSRDNTIATGMLNVEHVGGLRPHDSYTFTLNVYACYGALLYTNTQTDNDFTKAVLNAVAAYQTDHPENNG